MLLILFTFWLLAYPSILRYWDYFDIYRLEIKYRDEEKAKDRKIAVIIYYSVAVLLLLFQILNIIIER